MDRSARPLRARGILNLTVNPASQWPTNGYIYIFGRIDGNSMPEGKYEYRFNDSSHYPGSDANTQELGLFYVGDGQFTANHNYLTLELDNDSEVVVYFPVGYIFTPNSANGFVGLILWIAEDGSTYWARRDPVSTDWYWGDYMKYFLQTFIQRDPVYSMRHAGYTGSDYNGLARSANHDGNNDSPALDSGDPTMHSLATTNINQSMDNSAIDAGYHYGGYAYGNIRSNAIVEFYDDTLHLQEDSGVVDFYVVRTGAEDIEFSIDYETIADTAIAHNPPNTIGDFIPAQGTVTFEPYETYKVIPITIIDNSSTQENAEKFSVEISLSSGSQNVTLGGNTEATAQQAAHEEGQPGPTPTPTPGWVATPAPLTADIDPHQVDPNSNIPISAYDTIWIGANAEDIDTYMYYANGTENQIPERQEIYTRWYVKEPNDSDFQPLGEGSDKSAYPMRAIPLDIHEAGEYRIQLRMEDTQPDGVQLSRVDDPPASPEIIITALPTLDAPTPDLTATCMQGIQVVFGITPLPTQIPPGNKMLALHGAPFPTTGPFGLNASVITGSSTPSPTPEISRYHLKKGVDALPQFICHYEDQDGGD